MTPHMKPDPRDWARRILARKAAGEKVNPASFVMATAAMAGKASALVAE